LLKLGIGSRQLGSSGFLFESSRDTFVLTNHIVHVQQMLLLERRLKIFR
jgi:hypothetical protein